MRRLPRHDTFCSHGDELAPARRRGRPLAGALLASAVAVALVVSGCSSDDDDGASSDPTEQSGSGSGVDLGVDGDGPEVNIDAGDAGSTQIGGGVPQGFPDEVPLLEDYMVLQGQLQDGGGAEAWLLIGTVPDDATSVRERVEELYGVPSSDESVGETIVLAFDDVNGYPVEANLQPNADGDTALTIAVRPE